MQHLQVSVHAQLHSRIAYLKTNKLHQEQHIQKTFNELVSDLSPTVLLKRTLKELAADSSVQFDVIKMGLYATTNFFIDKIVGRNESLKGFLSAVMVENFTNSFISGSASQIVPVIMDWIQRFIKKINAHG